MKRCPNCGRGSLFSGWGRHLDKCPECGLIYERNPGDTWAFTIIGDRLPVALIIVLLYVGFVRSHRVVGFGAIAVVLLLLVWTSPNLWGVCIALHYLSRRYWPIRRCPPGEMAGRRPAGPDSTSSWILSSALSSSATDGCHIQIGKQHRRRRAARDGLLAASR